MITSSDQDSAAAKVDPQTKLQEFHDNTTAVMKTSAFLDKPSNENPIPEISRNSSGEDDAVCMTDDELDVLKQKKSYKLVGADSEAASNRVDDCDLDVASIAKDVEQSDENSICRNHIKIEHEKQMNRPREITKVEEANGDSGNGDTTDIITPDSPAGNLNRTDEVCMFTNELSSDDIFCPYHFSLFKYYFHFFLTSFTEIMRT